MKLSNWSNTFHCDASSYFTPETEDEIIDIINSAVNNSKCLKVIGSLHSPSAIALTNDYIISLEKFQQIKSLDKNKRLLCVQAGCKLKKINEYLEKEGFALSNLGSISEQSISGAISTGTHGTGLEFGPLSSSIVSLKIITGQNKILNLSLNENRDIFRASLCGLGCIGIITEVTLSVEPKFNLKVNQFLVPFDVLINNWEHLITLGQHVRFWYFPYCESVLVWIANRTSQPREPKSNYVKEKFFGYYLFEFILFFSKSSTLMTSKVNQLYFRYLYELRYPLITSEQLKSKEFKLDDFPDTFETIEVSWKVFNFDCLFKQYVSEWAVGVTEGKFVLSELRSSIINSAIPASFPVEIRFVSKDISMIGMTSERDSCFIGIIAYRPYGTDPPMKEYWNIFESLMKKHQGRPHWAKDNSLTYEELSSLYPEWRRFAQVRQTIDPNGIFMNNYLQRKLLPSPGSKL